MNSSKTNICTLIKTCMCFAILFLIVGCSIRDSGLRDNPLDAIQTRKNLSTYQLVRQVRTGQDGLIDVALFKDDLDCVLIAVTSQQGKSWKFEGSEEWCLPSSEVDLVRELQRTDLTTPLYAVYGLASRGDEAEIHWPDTTKAVQMLNDGAFLFITNVHQAHETVRFSP